MRRLALITAALAASAALAAGVAGADDTHTYKLETYNAFGLVDDAEVKVAGVNSGTITDLDVNEDKRAVVTVELTGPLAVLGEKTECSAEPQSLIAEYFLDCKPAGKPLEDGETLPNLVSQTVQPDLVAATLRMPYKQRLQLLINEFGTALAGNAENLNEAIRLGAPALQDLHEALKLLADQNEVIAQLNVDSDQIIAKLAERSDDVVAFVREAGDAAVASAERRDDLSTDFDLLDNFLRELGPTMAELENVARESTPLLADLRSAAPGLNTLATNLPAFARATERSLVSLGKAAGPGIKALRRGQDEIKALGEAGEGAPETAKQLKLFLDDIADPRRAVAIDDRVPADTGRTNPEAGQRDTKGYTGMEGLLNYFYYFGGALNQFDSVGHFLHFSLYDVFQGDCGEWNAAQDWPDDIPGGDGRTTDPLHAAPCVGMLGPNQPGITEGEDESDLGVGPYHPSVCPDGSTDLEICDPDGPAPFTARQRATGGGGSGAGGGDTGGAQGAGPGLPNGPQSPDEIRDALEDLLDLPGKTLGNLGLGGKGGGKNLGDGAKGLDAGADQAAQTLLDFLLGP